MSVATAATLITIAKSFRKVASCMSDVLPRLKQILEQTLRISGVKGLHQHKGSRTPRLTGKSFAPASLTCPTPRRKKDLLETGLTS